MTEAYRLALETAIAATRAGGAILRADFLKPGGPDGEGEHADADERAERVIRERLLTAFPNWSYIGEETGDVPVEGADHIWLVDPNDGTNAYLRGYRGTATAVGALRVEGDRAVPVLGVVYAFCAPLGGEDLLAWAEGGGPIVRNGVPVERAGWPVEITTDTICTLTQDADLAPIAYLRTTAPARYLAIPSIAHRLALLAAGVGDATVSLSGPGDYDYAAGHALLRAAGGTLLDERGERVRYTAEGRSKSRYCFAGSSEVAGELAGRSWDAAREAGHDPASEEFDLTAPVRGAAIADDALLGRINGCWLGQLTGDALGSQVEFQSGQALRQPYPNGLRTIGPSSVWPSSVWHTLAGQPTDDSELALMLARSLLREGRYEAEAVAGAYTYWLRSRPFDIGNTIDQALRAMERAPEGRRAQAGREAASTSSQANGALMRQSPLAIWGFSHATEEIDATVRADTQLTHPNRVCQDASAVFIVALAAVIRDGLDGEGAYRVALEWARRCDVDRAVVAALEAARGERPVYTEHEGWVLVALQNAFYQALHAPTFEEGLVDTVMGGGDTDTNGAIAGALLGALHGAGGVPRQWREAVLSCRPQDGMPGVQQPRPRAFWPVDAPYLAERLAVAGLRGTAIPDADR